MLSEFETGELGAALFVARLQVFQQYNVELTFAFIAIKLQFTGLPGYESRLAILLSIRKRFKWVGGTKGLWIANSRQDLRLIP